MGSKPRIHRAKSAVRRFVATSCCILLPLGVSAQIIEAPPMPAQSIGAMADLPARTGAPMSARAGGTSGGSDLSRYQELTDIGTKRSDDVGVQEELRQAHAHYCKAAGNGSTDALVRLGWMYANGLGVAQDDTVASSLFKRAASYGSRIGAQMAMMIRSFDERFPDCLGRRKFARVDIEPAQPVSRASSQMDDPARFSTSAPSLERQRIAAMVVNQAKEFRIDPRLVMAVIGTESNFDPSARSPKNAFGLMQLIPETAARFSVTDPLDPAQNLRGGMAYLSWLLSYFRGDVVLALAGYNAGEGAVDRYKGVPPFAETMAYVQRIRAMYPHDRHSYNARLTSASQFIRELPKTARLAAQTLE